MRTTRTPRPALVLAGGVLALVLAGCGSDAAGPAGAGSAGGAPPATEEGAPAEDTAEPADDEATDEATGDEMTGDEMTGDEATGDEMTEAAGAAAEVALRDDDGFVFDPTEVTVAAGDTVTWVHEGQVSHTVTAEDDSFDSGTLAAGDTFEMTFDEPGSYPYFCGFHGSMRGTVTVE